MAERYPEGRPTTPWTYSRGSGDGLALYRDKIAEIEGRIDRLHSLRDHLRRRLAEIEDEVPARNGAAGRSA